MKATRLSRCLPKKIGTDRLEIDIVRAGSDVVAVGVGFPGIIHDGVIEESPNLPQMKGKVLGRPFVIFSVSPGLTLLWRL